MEYHTILFDDTAFYAKIILKDNKYPQKHTHYEKVR